MMATSPRTRRVFAVSAALVCAGAALIVWRWAAERREEQATISVEKAPEGFEIGVSCERLAAKVAAVFSTEATQKSARGWETRLNNDGRSVVELHTAKGEDVDQWAAGLAAASPGSCRFGITRTTKEGTTLVRSRVRQLVAELQAIGLIDEVAARKAERLAVGNKRL